MDALTWGWLGAGLLLLAGFGWGRQVSGPGVTGSWLAAMLILSLAGLFLVAQSALAGHDLPVSVGLVGAVAASLISVFMSD
ncbi:hypothetical protein [Deinococcus sp. Marseille-Q6407]|uniref:hypothetical protein n=1 Tax=Deinococcus sp. Marseille-Q6407 TaxID=2969223 RepID=UPI0021C03F9D|nr:hypothetical protein [Deinococcus sp. Marseille-Q6407]